MRTALIRNSCEMFRSKWAFPLFAIGLGVAMFFALWIGGDPLGGVYAGAVIAVLGVLVLIGGRSSETIRALRGDGKDERFHRIDISATAFAGTVLILVLIGTWMVEVARGHDGNPYGLLSAIAGLSYLAAVLFMRWRG